LTQLVDSAIQQTQDLVKSFKVGNVIKNGVSAAIIGKPNAGKSTLLNALLKDDRAIVSDIAGTTRDTVEEVINIEGIMFRLIDTAGIRRHTSDSIESAGIERSREKMRHSDLVLYLFDVAETSMDELTEVTNELDELAVPYILVGNKTDKLIGDDLANKFSSRPDVTFISAHTNADIGLLESKMVKTILDESFHSENVIVTNARHYHALQEVASALSDVSKGLADKISGDLLALDIRRCLQYVGEITGEVTNEDQLDYIFSKFCIGK
jgi:tRNA modification GTPase